MKHVQYGEAFALKKNVTEDILKAQLKKRLESVFVIRKFKEDGESVAIDVTSGGPSSFVRHAAISAKVDLMVEDGKARVVVTAAAKPATSLSAFYALGLLIVLLLGLLPGSLNTSWEDAGAADAIVFLVIGAYIVYDIETKLNEGCRLLGDVLRSLQVEFEA